jgi:hypothetical protein
MDTDTRAKFLEEAHLDLGILEVYGLPDLLPFVAVTDFVMPVGVGG